MPVELVRARHADVERRGDERMSHPAEADVLGDPGAAGGPADYPGGAVPVQPLPVRSAEERIDYGFALMSI